MSRRARSSARQKQEHHGGCQEESGTYAPFHQNVSLCHVTKAQLLERTASSDSAGLAGHRPPRAVGILAIGTLGAVVDAALHVDHPWLAVRPDGNAGRGAIDLIPATGRTRIEVRDGVATRID